MTVVWLSPDVPLEQLPFPFLVMACGGFICYRLVGAPVLVLRETDLETTGVFETWTIPYSEIDKLDASNGLTLHLRGGEEVFITAMPGSLFQAITGDRRLARLHDLLDERVKAAAGQVPARSRTRSTLVPLLRQIAVVVAVFTATYLIALTAKLL